MSYELRFWLGGVLKTDPVFKQKMQSGKEISSHKTCLTADKYAFTECGFLKINEIICVKWL